MEDYWKSEWMLLSRSYSELKKENRNLKIRNTQLHKKYCDLRLNYEMLMLKEDLEKEELQKQKKKVIIY